jgi:hypothetical protein
LPAEESEAFRCIWWEKAAAAARKQLAALARSGENCHREAENLYTSEPAAVTALNDRLVKFNGAANNHGSETFLRTRCTTLLALDMRSG